MSIIKRYLELEEGDQYFIDSAGYLISPLGGRGAGLEKFVDGNIRVNKSLNPIQDINASIELYEPWAEVKLDEIEWQRYSPKD